MTVIRSAIFIFELKQTTNNVCCEIDRIFDQDFIDTKVEQEVEFKLKAKIRQWEKLQ
jgi:hypothetical protein